MLLAVLLAAGCASTPEQTEAGAKPQDDRPYTAMQGVLQASEAHSAQAAADAPPPEVMAELLPPVTLNNAVSKPVEPRFDIDVNRAPARAFFMSLVDGTPHNMVVHPSVEGSISLTLKNVTVPEVMEVVREVYGYEYQRNRTGYIVSPRRLQSKIFYVNYLNLQRLGKSKTGVSAGGISDTTPSDQDKDSPVTKSDETQTEIFGSRVDTNSASDVWSELTLALQAIIGDGEGRSVVVSPQANMVVVRAMPSELRDIEAFLTGAQTSLARQVIIEAKILEVTLSDGFQSGINWALLSESGGDVLLASQTGGGTVFGDTGLSDIAGESGDLNPDSPDFINTTLASAFGGVFSVLVNVGDFAAFIELLSTQGDVEILSSPRVSTVNNQKALIKVGSDEYFVTDISTTTTTGTATTTTPSITLTPFFSGIALDVTPQISDGGDVTLHIHPAISRVEDQVKSITFGLSDDTGEAPTVSLPLAFSTVRESDSIVRAKSGQIVVIGGLMEELIQEEIASTPVLGDIPLVGNLFRHTRTSKRKTELVILLRPVVVDHDQVWTDSIRDSTERFNQMYSGQQHLPVNRKW